MKQICTLPSTTSIVYDYFGGFCMAAGLVDHKQRKFYPFNILSLLHLTRTVSLSPDDIVTVSGKSVIGLPCPLLYTHMVEKSLKEK